MEQKPQGFPTPGLLANRDPKSFEHSWTPRNPLGLQMAKALTCKALYSVCGVKHSRGQPVRSEENEMDLGLDGEITQGNVGAQPCIESIDPGFIETGRRWGGEADDQENEVDMFDLKEAEAQGDGHAINEQTAMTGVFSNQQGGFIRCVRGTVA